MLAPLASIDGNLTFPDPVGNHSPNTTITLHNGPVFFSLFGSRYSESPNPQIRALIQVSWQTNPMIVTKQIQCVYTFNCMLKSINFTIGFFRTHKIKKHESRKCFYNVFLTDKMRFFKEHYYSNDKLQFFN